VPVNMSTYKPKEVIIVDIPSQVINSAVVPFANIASERIALSRLRFYDRGRGWGVIHPLPHRRLGVSHCSGAARGVSWRTHQCSLELA